MYTKLEKLKNDTGSMNETLSAEEKAASKGAVKP